MIEEFVSDEDVEARQRLLVVKTQLDNVHAGTFDILCPYCDTLNRPSTELCCDTLRKAVITILMGRRQQQIEIANKYVH